MACKFTEWMTIFCVNFMCSCHVLSCRAVSCHLVSKLYKWISYSRKCRRDGISQCHFLKWYDNWTLLEQLSNNFDILHPKRYNFSNVKKTLAWIRWKIFAGLIHTWKWNVNNQFVKRSLSRCQSIWLFFNKQFTKRQNITLVTTLYTLTEVEPIFCSLLNHTNETACVYVLVLSVGERTRKLLFFTWNAIAYASIHVPCVEQ